MCIEVDLWDFFTKNAAQQSDHEKYKHNTNWEKMRVGGSAPFSPIISYHETHRAIKANFGLIKTYLVRENLD